MTAADLIARLSELPASAEILVVPEDIKRDSTHINTLAQHIDGIKCPVFWSREQRRDHESAHLYFLITRNF